MNNIFQIANTQLRMKNYSEAIKLYNLIIQEDKKISKLIKFNLKYAQEKNKVNKSENKNLFINEKYFDREYYVLNNQDVGDAKIDPWDHYISQGWREGRNPTPNLKLNNYNRVNPLDLYYSGGFRCELIINQDIPNWMRQNFDASVARYFNKKEEQLFSDDDVVYDIVIPVFNGFEYLDKLVNSIYKNTTCNYRLIFGNDCSTDLRVKEYLKKLKKRGRCLEIILIENEKNIGFVANVNNLVKYTKYNFVLLNTDVEVPKNWLQRLFKPIVLDENIASTTPFSNSATIFSFPEYIKDNLIYKNLSVEIIDKYFSKINQTNTQIEVPTGVGFCMGISKKVADEIGMFDEEYGKGYCEENDWCMRAKKYGFKHIHVTNLYVYHKHGGSFEAEERKKLQLNNYAKLEKKYPHYTELISTTVSDNKLINLRRVIKNLIDFDQLKSNHEKFESLPVFYVGHLSSNSGVGEAARGYVKALLTKKLEVVCFDLADSEWINNFKILFGWKLPSSVVWHMTAAEINNLSTYHSELLVDVKNNVHTVGVWAWESDQPADIFNRSSQYISEIWAISSYVSKAFTMLNNSKSVIPHVIDTNKFNAYKEIPFIRALREKYNFIVGYIFDLRSYLFRKNPIGVIDAFLGAFSDIDDACLILKVSGVDECNEDYQFLIKYIGNRANIYVITENFNSLELNYFYSILDVYLALFRAEGFGLTIAEAVASNVPVISTKYSGVLDFLSDTDGVYFVDYSLVNLPENWGPYSKHFLWADPNISQASNYLTNLYRNKNGILDGASLKYLRDKTSTEVVGNLCFDSLFNGFCVNHIYFNI